jgi:ligand-binding sensor domain-containing protein
VIKFFAILFLILPLAFANGSFLFSQGVVSHEMTVFNEQNSPLPNNSIHALLIDHENALWIATDLGLCKLVDDQWEIYNTLNSGLTDNYIRALAVDENDVLWIGTVTGGLFRFDGTNWTNFTTANSLLPTNFVRSLAVDLSGDLWVGTVEGLLKFDGTNWAIWTIENSGIFSQNISAIAVGFNNEKYCGTINGGAIYVSPTDEVQNHTIASAGIPDNSTAMIQIDQTGRPWFATPAAGLFTDTGSLTWLSINMNNSALPTNSLTAFHLDKFQNFLLGTDQYGMVVRNVNGTFRSYNATNSELPENHVISITRDSSKTYWIGMNSKGLVKLTEQYAQIDELSNDAFMIFPNPTNSGQELYFSKPMEVEKIALISAEGKVVFEKNYDEKLNSIELPDLTQGTYLLRITNSITSFNKRLIIN